MNQPRLPPLNTLRAFEAAARHNSFVKAGAELHLTAAAISHQVKELEQALGFVLFKRKARGIELTNDGLRYRDRIAEALKIIQKATAEAGQTTADGPLTLSVPESFAQLWLIPRLYRLTQRFSGLQLTIAGENRLANVLSGEVDLAIRFGTGVYAGLASEFLLGDAVTVLIPTPWMTKFTDTRPESLIRCSTLLEDYQTAPNEPWMGW